MISVFLLVAAGLLFIASVVMMAYARYCFVTYSRKLSDCLDGMIAGRKDIEFEEEEDGLIGRVQVRMRQLYEIMQKRTEVSQRNQKNLEKTISDISHQLKNPIASIRTYQNILLRPNIDEKDRMEFLHNAEKQVDKLEFI